MSRVLVLEPDPAVLRVLEQALVSAGFTVRAVVDVASAKGALDQEATVDVVVLELRAFGDEAVARLAAFRGDHPDVPIVLTASLLTTRLLVEVVRLRIDDVLAKPFTPRALRTSLERVLDRRRAVAVGALDYAAAMAAARRVLGEGRVGEAEPLLRRVRAVAPLDAEAMALFGLARELAGEDHAAGLAYRAALALADGVLDGPDPWQGLARLARYGGAPCTPAVLPPSPRLARLDDAAAEADADVDALVATAGLESATTGVVRRPPGGRPIVLFAGPDGPPLARWLSRTFAEPRLVSPPTRTDPETGEER